MKTKIFALIGILCMTIFPGFSQTSVKPSPKLVITDSMLADYGVISVVQSIYQSLFSPTEENKMTFSGTIVDASSKPVSDLVIYLLPIFSGDQPDLILGRTSSGGAGFINPKCKTNQNGFFEIITGDLWTKAEKIILGLMIHNSPDRPFDVSILPVSTTDNKPFEIKLSETTRVVKTEKVVLKVNGKGKLGI